MEYDSTNCYVYFNNNIIVHGPRDEKAKLWAFPLWTNPKPTPSRQNSNSNFPMSRQSINNTIYLISPTFRISNTSENYLQHHPIFTTHRNMDYCHCQSPLHGLTSSYCHCYSLTPPYQEQKSKDTPSNHHRTCYPQLQQPHKNNN